MSERLFIVDLNNLVVRYCFAIIGKRKKDNKENTLPYLSSRNGAASYVNHHLQMAGYKYGDEVIIAREGSLPWRYDMIDNYKNYQGRSSDDKEQRVRIRSVVDGSFVLMETRINHTSVQSNIAEADDIIATIALVQENKNKEITILSDDKDFKQLLTYTDNIKLYSQVKKKFIEPEDYSLMKHILYGDKSDNIPSVLNYGDTGLVVDGTRKTKFTEKIKKLIIDDNENFIANNIPDINDGFLLNQTLIDLRYIPDEVKEDILLSYNERKMKLNNQHTDNLVMVS